jgi:hypothetical protein
VLELRPPDAQVGRLRASRFKLGLRLRDVHSRDDSLVEPVDRHPERLVERGDVGVEQRLLRVDPA